MLYVDEDQIGTFFLGMPTAQDKDDEAIFMQYNTGMHVRNNDDYQYFATRYTGDDRDQFTAYVDDCVHAFESGYAEGMKSNSKSV